MRFHSFAVGNNSSRALRRARPMLLLIGAFVVVGMSARASSADSGLPATPPSIDPTGVRVPAPVGVELDRAERRVGDAYEAELADKSDAGRRKLLQLMLNDAVQTHDDSAGRYVLLREARRLALSVNDATTVDYLTHQIEALYSLVGGASAGIGDALPSSAPPRTRARLPVPSDAAYGDARKKLKTKYAQYYANSTALVRSSLLGKLMADVDGAADAADQYATLREAADVAINIGDLKTASQCNALVASIFQIEETDLRLAMLVTAGPQAGKLIPARDLLLADLNLADDAVKADNYDAAARALTLAASVLTSASDEALSARYKKREKEIREMREEFLHAAVAIKKVVESPDDKEMNLKAGRFYCLSAGNWTKGLPMLAKGSDITMKLLAEGELGNPSTVDAQLKLADGWWDHSSSEIGAAGVHCKSRAGYWYRKAKVASQEELPDRVTTRLLSTTRAIDLLALMNPSRDRVSGQWTGAAGRLTCTNAGVSRLQFPCTLPEEFDFAVQFTIHRTGDHVAQIVPTHDSYFAWTMGANRTAFETIDPNSAHPVYTHFAFISNKPYLSVVEVRRTGVRAVVNGTVVGEWKTSFTDFTAPNVWKLGDPHMLGFGSAFTEVTLQSARLINLSPDAE